MRKLGIILLALLALLVAVPAGSASAAVAAPLGSFDSAVTNTFDNSVVMSGWALDRGVRNLPTSVEVTVDGATAGGWRMAAVLRTDVNRAESSTGGHGFSIRITLAPGQHVICVNTRSRADTQTTSLGCFGFEAYRMATQADMAAVARSIDPKGSINWLWRALPDGTSGLAQPWLRQVQIGSGHTIHNLRDVMIHEWSHVLQYRAFAGADPWWDAVQAFNALLGHPTDRQSYAGIEHGADCIAAALGAQYLGYGCSPALQVYANQIARGVMMNKLQGGVDSVTAAGSTVTVTGWALDPAAPTTSSTVLITDNGHAVTGWTRTAGTRVDVNRSTGTFGAHGFSVKVSLPDGQHRICVSAQFVKAGKAAATVGNCSTVTTA